MTSRYVLPEVTVIVEKKNIVNKISTCVTHCEDYFHTFINIVKKYYLTSRA